MRFVRSLTVVLFSLLAACTQKEGAAAGGVPGDACRVIDRAIPLPKRVAETSGLAASRAHPGILWTHNDSGGDPELIAVDSAGSRRGVVRVTGADAVDWEDIAVGGCAGGDCLYVGDIGDNDGDRAQIDVYRFMEPSPEAAATARAERIVLRYPDHPQDAEGLFVLPGGDLFVVTKGVHGPVTLYRAPAPVTAGAPITLQRVVALGAREEERLNMATGADATPDGRWVAVRTYTGLHLFRAEALRGEGTPVSDRFDLASLEEPQGEAVAIRDDGTVFLSSESPGKDQPATMSRLACSLR